MERQDDTGHTRVLALYPNSRGFAYAFFAGPQELIDWGLQSTRAHRNARVLAKIRTQIELYRPDLILIEDHAGEGSRRGLRIQKLLDAIEVLGGDMGVGVSKLSMSQIRGVFELFGATTKYERAGFINTALPTNLPMPPMRKPWVGEDYRMGVFDACSLAITYYYLEPEF